MSGAPRPLDSLLRRPYPCDHIIQVYSNDNVLIRALSRFVGGGLEQGEAAVVIAVPQHISALSRELTANGIRSKAEDGAFVAIDAERCLAGFMVDVMPDPVAFRSAMTAILDRLRDAGYRKIRLFGEMVNLLWEENLEATLRLEELWNGLVAEYQVCLMCAYRIDSTGADRKRGVLHLITRSHSHSFSEEHDALLTQAINDRPEGDLPPHGPRSQIR